MQYDEYHPVHNPPNSRQTTVWPGHVSLSIAHHQSLFDVNGIDSVALSFQAPVKLFCGINLSVMWLT